MKTIRLTYFSLPVLAFLIAGCGGLGTMVKKYPTVTYKVTPEILETHGGKVEVKIDGTFPPKYFNKKATIALTPVLKFEGGEKTLKPGINNTSAAPPLKLWRASGRPSQPMN